MLKHGLTVFVMSMGLATVLPAAGQAETHQRPRSIDSSKAGAKPYGRPADAKQAKRTIHVEMSDDMRFSPAEIEVRSNDTVRFVVKNSGKQMHEMVLGTMEELKEHADLMRRHRGMEHDDAWMVHVAPGKRGELGWQFTKRGTYYYGCLIPGHFEAGMLGKVVVK